MVSISKTAAMNHESPRRWHATGAGSNQDPSLFRLTGRQVTMFLLSLITAFALFALLSASGWNFILSLVAAALIPFGMLLFLLTLCCGRHEGYARHWWEARRARANREELLKINHLEIDHENH